MKKIGNFILDYLEDVLILLTFVGLLIIALAVMFEPIYKYFMS